MRVDFLPGLSDPSGSAIFLIGSELLINSSTDQAQQGKEYSKEYSKEYDKAHCYLYRKVLSACPHCDLIIKRHHMAANQYSICPRCHSTVEHKHGFDASFLKWTVMAALLFYIPANFYPLVSVDIAGSVQATSVFQGIILLFQQNKLMTAAIVLFCSLIVPTLIISIFATLLVARHYDALFFLQKYCVRVLVKLRDWSMMDIYLLSFFVTIFKVQDVGEVDMQIGLLAYVGLAVCINKLFISYDKRALWRLITKSRTFAQ